MQSIEIQQAGNQQEIHEPVATIPSHMEMLHAHEPRPPDKGNATLGDSHNDVSQGTSDKEEGHMDESKESSDEEDTSGNPRFGLYLRILGFVSLFFGDFHDCSSKKIGLECSWSCQS